MPTSTFRPPIRVAALAAAVLVAACGRGSSGDAALRRDLDAAGGNGLALAPRGATTQVVSSLELGDGKANPAGAPAASTTGAPARAASAPPRAAASPLPPRVITRVRYVDRVEESPAPARADVAAPTPAPEVAPTPAPRSTDEPTVVAAPSPGARRLPSTTDEPAARGRGRRGTWDMGDVIRNAPFPINP